MALPEEEIETLLRNGGLLNGWVDSRGNPQPAPVVQIGMFREAEIDQDKRCILIRKNGGAGGDEWLRNPGISVYMFGTVTDAFLVVAERTGQILEYLLDNYQEGRTIGVTPLSDVEGPFNTDSGRPVYEINLQTIIAR